MPGRGRGKASSPKGVVLVVEQLEQEDAAQA